MSPAKRRQAVHHVQKDMELSLRRACKVLGQPRSTQRLLERIHELVRKYLRYGYRMITAKLRQEGWRVNFKRIYRIWRVEGLKVP